MLPKSLSSWRERNDASPSKTAVPVTRPAKAKDMECPHCTPHTKEYMYKIIVCVGMCLAQDSSRQGTGVGQRGRIKRQMEQERVVRVFKGQEGVGKSKKNSRRTKRRAILRGIREGAEIKTKQKVRV